MLMYVLPYNIISQCDLINWVWEPKIGFQDVVFLSSRVSFQPCILKLCYFLGPLESHRSVSCGLGYARVC